MLKFYCNYKALLCTLWIAMAVVPTQSNVIRGKLPSVPEIASLIHAFVKPYMERQFDTPHLKKPSTVSKAIKKKVESLKPYLQDSESIYVDKYDIVPKFAVEESTTKSKQIMREPKKHVAVDVENYEKLRDKVQKALRKEVISDKTKDMVLSILDNMTERIRTNQCFDSNQRTGKDPQLEAITVATIWKTLWKHIQSEITPTFKSQDGKENHLNSFLKHFGHFVSNVINDTNILRDNYKFDCNLLRKREETTPEPDLTLRANIQQLRMGDTEIVDSDCEGFKVCSIELTDFMESFYLNLNDTAVTTLGNYGAMFIRDVTSDSGNDKSFVVKQITRTTNELEHKIELIFIKRLDKFQLDKQKYKTANINALTYFVKKTIGHVKKQIMRDLTDYLKTLRMRLMTNIKKDIEVNLDVDLGNLERDLSSKVCAIFSACNGNLSRRKSGNDTAKINENDLFIQMRLTLDKNRNQVKVDRRIGDGVDQAMKSVDDRENEIVAANDSTSSNVTRTYPPLYRRQSSTSTSDRNAKYNVPLVYRLVMDDDEPDTFIVDKPLETFYKRH